MKIGDIVIAPAYCETYLTAGKEYPIIKVWTGKTEGFDIIDDSGEVIGCSKETSCHLNFGDWILKPTIQ